MKKLKTVKVEAAHPLLLPGMLTELELDRHIRLIEGNINEVESKIFELNFESTRTHESSRSEIETRRESKRTAWLNLSYLRNSLVTWNTQLLKMIECAEALNQEEYTESIAESVTSTRSSTVVDENCHSAEDNQKLEKEVIFEEEDVILVKTESMLMALASLGSTFEDHILPTYQEEETEHSEPEDGFKTMVFTEVTRQAPSESGESHKILVFARENKREHVEQMRKTGVKIKTRLVAIRDEYDEKIRDCTMRVEGMAMATQWASISRLSLHSLMLISSSHKVRPRWRSQLQRIGIPQSCVRYLW